MLIFPSIPHIKDLKYPCDTRVPFGYPSNLVFTEKLDGLNVMLRHGLIFDRSGNSANGGYYAMVKKHVAWRTIDYPEYAVWGEDLYAEHSCIYEPIREDKTFFVFMITFQDIVLGWQETCRVAYKMGLQTVPYWCEGKESNSVRFANLKCAFNHYLDEPSLIGGEREGIVIRNRHGWYFHNTDKNMVKLVRKGHVQPDAEHWRKNWKPRNIEPFNLRVDL